MKKSFEANSDTCEYTLEECCIRTHQSRCIARCGPSPSAKGKAKAYSPPTRASPRLAVLRAKASPHSPTPSLPPKRHHIPAIALVSPLAMGNNTSKISAKHIRRRSQRIADRGGTSTSAPKEKVVIAISSDFELEPKLEDTIREVVEMDEDPEEKLKEEPQVAEVEEDPEEDSEEAEDEVEGQFRREDDYEDYWQLVESE
ncbi:hypothetical protein PIB30_095742 [Stylosanthes scabra]|uniref:Uncharacterized protein n=1 Tax=Stylosanthes scabra TaxID=79078 RepID=A0ABU6WYW3_9FABA|nr:hypothetical protein [Stylosanthes scabra]